MSAAPEIADDQTVTPMPAVGAATHAVDNAAWHDRQLAILSELAEAGLEIALALKGRIVATAALEADPACPSASSAACASACADLTRAFDRASRATRMSIALRERLAKDAATGGRGAQAGADDARARRAERVRRIVRRIAKARYGEGLARESLDDRARERLFDRDITGDLNAPIGALVAQICADLGLSPPWLAMAQEAWAQAEIAERPPGSPYAAWPELPPDEADGAEDFGEDFGEGADGDDDDDDDWDDPGGGDP